MKPFKRERVEENGMRKKRVTTSEGKTGSKKKIRYERVECIIIARLFPLGSCACVGWKILFFFVLSFFLQRKHLYDEESGSVYNLSIFCVFDAFQVQEGVQNGGVSDSNAASSSSNNTEAERVRKLRERVEAQEAKLRKLRALRGQVDQQRITNGSLGKYLAISCSCFFSFFPFFEKSFF